MKWTLIIFRQQVALATTLGSEINVPLGINVPPGTLDKKNKRAPWLINHLCYKNSNFVAYGSYFIQKMHFF